MVSCTTPLRGYLLIFALRTEPGVTLTILPEKRKNSKCHARSHLGCARGHPIYTNGGLLSVPDARGQGQSVLLQRTVGPLKLDLNPCWTRTIALKYSFIVNNCSFTRF